MIFFDAIGNIRTSKVFWATTYGVLPMCTKACGGVRLGSIRLGKVWLGWVRLGKVRLCSVRLD